MDISGRTVLVTGGAGFVGHHLVRALLVRQCRVRVLDHRPADTEGVEGIQGDVREPATWARALAGVDIVFHLAAAVGADTDARHYLDVNAGGTAELFRALEGDARSVRKVIVASSLGVYGEGSYRCGRDGLQHPELRQRAQLEQRQWEPLCPVCGGSLAPVPTSERAVAAPVSAYAVSKYAAERLALFMGRRVEVPAVALRYAVVYGAGQPLANPYSTVITAFASHLARREAPVLYEDGGQQRDFVYVDDVVHATMLAAEDERADFQVFNVGAGQGYTVRDLAAGLGQRFGWTRSFEASQQFRVGDYRHLVLDTAKLRALGWEVSVPLDEGLDRFVHWLRRESAGPPG